MTDEIFENSVSGYLRLYFRNDRLQGCTGQIVKFKKPAVIVNQKKTVSWSLWEVVDVPFVGDSCEHYKFHRSSPHLQ